MNINIRFEVIIFVIFLIMIISEYIAYSSFHTAGIIRSEKLEITLMILGITVPLMFLISMVYAYRHYSLLNAIANTIGSVWISLVFFIFIISLIIFVLIMTNSHWGTKIPIHTISQILIVLAIFTTAYGIWNSNHIEKIIYNINTEGLKNNWNNSKVILISDLHIGNLRRENFVKKIVSIINSENPDYLFIAGDLIEGHSFPYQEWLGYLENINPKTKIFYVEGNHEKYNLEYDTFKKGIPENIINVTDKKLIVNNTQIIGLHYIERESSENTLQRLKDLNYEKDKPSIVLIHDPKNAEALLQEGVTLVLSGHTHKGQFIPLTWLIKYIYKDSAYGANEINDATSIVSSGVGTSMIPLRIGTKSEITIININ